MNKINVETVRVILERTFQMPVSESDARIVTDRLNKIIHPAVYERHDTKGVYCKRCEFLVEFGDMKPYRKDNDTVDMLCPGCDTVLVEGE